MHKHSKTHHKIVYHILKTIAHQIQKPFSEIKIAFIHGNPSITCRFAELLNKSYPKAFTGVSHCPHCDKFSLET